MVKAVAEAKRIIAFREKTIGSEGGNVLGICLSSRKNMCIHKEVMDAADQEAVDSKCRSMTASWVRQNGNVDANVELCNYYGTFMGFLATLSLYLSISLFVY